MEQRINTLKNEIDIFNVLKQFASDLKSLGQGEGYRREMAKKFAQRAEFLVISIEKNIAGFIAFYMNDFSQKEAYISMLAVHEKYRRLGLGKFLLKRCITLVKDIGMVSIKLEVAIDNKTAITFYENNGFEIYANSETSYYMKRILKI